MPSITEALAAAPYASATVPCSARAAINHEATFVLSRATAFVTDNQGISVCKPHSQQQQVWPRQQQHALSDTTWDACCDRYFTADY